MNGNNKYILAMYDIRGKQNYIYKGRKIKEIMGASFIIRDCFKDYLFPVANEIFEKGIFHYANQSKAPFSVTTFEERMQSGEYAGEVVYEGGGNIIVLYRDKDTYNRVNELFYKNLFKNTYSLRVLTSYIEGVDFDDYNADRNKLQKIHAENERREWITHPVNSLPIVQVDYKTSMPLSIRNKKAEDKLSIEANAKYMKYEEITKDSDDQGEKLLEKLITKKGTDSHLAVIYIDGNNIGAQVQKATHGMKTYEDSIAAIREISNNIEKSYIKKPLERLNNFFKGCDDCNNKTPGCNVGCSRNKKGRLVVHAGDELTIICNATDAYRVVNEYFDAIWNEEGDPHLSSCAGVAIFHSHAPYYEAYRIAEECCESCKTQIKLNETKRRDKNKFPSVCLVDFHYCQNAIGNSLEDIREHEGTTTMCKPWVIHNDGNIEFEDLPDKDRVEKLANALISIARSNSKKLLSAAKLNDSRFKNEIGRIRAHEQKESIRKKISMVEAEHELIYRIMTVYDEWFKKGI